jgi:opacity protein-like surface antigen
MRKSIVLSAVSITLLASAALVAQAQQPAPAPPAVISFFVAVNANQTGNLGGLAGADQMCQTQAQALGGANAARTWRAYLSQEQRGNTPRINARDRIGPGPWFNVKGTLIASNVADLHGDQQRDRNNVQKANVLDVKGEVIPGVGVPQGTQNEHDALTGSDPQGRAFTDGLDHTCGNWTSDGLALPQANPNFPAERARAMLGHTDRTGGGNVSWNAVHMSQGCSKAALNATGGTGRFYCFATN